MSCDKKNNNGCKGGYIANTADYLNNVGFISEECWESIKTEDDKCPTKENLSKCTKEYIDMYCVYESVDEI